MIQGHQAILYDDYRAFKIDLNGFFDMSRIIEWLNATIYKASMLPKTYIKHLMGHLYTPYMTPGAKRASERPLPHASKTSNFRKRDHFFTSS